VKRSDYDSPWKVALEVYFQDFLAFFFPAVHGSVDWSQPVEFLDKELQRATRRARVGRRTVDKLVKVHLTMGGEAWVLIHIEIQGQREEGFGERIFVYRYRLFDRFRVPVTTLVVLTDGDPAWRPDGYRTELLGTELVLRFPVAKLLDYNERWAELEASRSPFAVVVMAQLKALETARRPKERLWWKIAVTRSLYDRGFREADVQELFRFVDWLLVLPEELEQAFEESLGELEKEKKMQYVSVLERKAERRGMQQGMQQGEVAVLRRQLQRKFGPLPQWAEERLELAPSEHLERWADLVLDAKTLEGVFGGA